MMRLAAAAAVLVLGIMTPHNPTTWHDAFAQDRPEVEVPLAHETVLLLDVSNSMAGVKLDAMQHAASHFIDAMGNATGAIPSRLAVLPFSARVNVGSWLMERGLLSKDSEFACVEEPAANLDHTEDIPADPGWRSSDDLTLVGWHQHAGRWSFDEFETAAPCPQPMIPLTTDWQHARQMVSELTTNGTARPDLAMVWALRALSPAWTGLSHERHAPSKTAKTIILVSDGELSTSFALESRIMADNRLQRLCAQARDEAIGVVVLSLASDADAENRLRECATSSRHVFKLDTSWGVSADADSIIRKFGPLSSPAVGPNLS